MNSEMRRDVLIAFSLAAAAALGFAVAYAVRGANNLYEFCHYLDIARNWTTGAGYTTRIVEPGVLAHLDAAGISGFPYPVTYRFPLFAALAALAVKVLGPTDLAVALVSGAVHVLLAVLIFAVGRAIFDRRSALLAAALYVTSPVFAGRYAVSGFADPVFALVLLGLHYILTRDGAWNARTALFAGVLLGLSYLARFNVTLFFPVYVVLAWRKAGARFALFLVAAAAIVAPLWAYNLRHFGALSAYPMASMNLAAFTVVPDSDPWRYYRTIGLADLLPHGRAILGKTVRNFAGEFVPGVAMLWNLPLVVAAFAMGLVRKDGGARRRFVLLGAGLLLWQGLAFSPLRLELSIPNPYYRGRYFFWFAPTLLLGGSHALLAYLGDRKRARAWVALFVAACVVIGLRDVNRRGYHFDPATDPAARALATLDPARDVLVSNMAVQAAAYFRVGGIELPADPDELAKLMVKHPASRLYLDRRYYLTPAWEALFRDHAAQERFTAATGFRPLSIVRDARGGLEGLMLGRD
jgi:hypothetical protein